MYKRQVDDEAVELQQRLPPHDDRYQHDAGQANDQKGQGEFQGQGAVSYTHLRAHETVLDIVCRLLLEKKIIQKKKKN